LYGQTVCLDLGNAQHVPVPNTKLKRSPDGRFLASAASVFSTTKSKMFFVEPTTPMFRSLFAAIASANISPGTSKCAVWYASP
jgi:hypothetical protein